MGSICILIIMLHHFPQKVVAATNGVWKATFASQVSNLSPTNITVTSGAGSVTLSRILWGDVILCSGQSNMGVPTSYILNNTAAIAAAETLKHSVRLFRVASGAGQKTEPQTNVTLLLEWTPATPAAVQGFSAVCWTFAMGLAAQRPSEFVQRRPLGLVLSEAGGTPIEAWMSSASAAKCAGVPTNAGCSNNGNLTSGLFNEQIAPLRGMMFKLAVWYQGESNALWDQFPNDAHTAESGYVCRYTQLIEGYRDALSFVGKQGWLTVQIAPYLGQHTKCVFPSIRFAQQTVGDVVPGVATVVIQDLGDPLSPPPAGSMHPRDKLEVGSRLASAALALGFIGNESAPPAPALTLTPTLLATHSAMNDTMNTTNSMAAATNTISSWGGPAFASITRTGPRTFTVQLARVAVTGLKMVGSRGCANVTMFDDGSTRTPTERCCDAPDTFQLWPSINATQQPAPWTSASGPTANVKCIVAGSTLECTAPAPINGEKLWTFAWQNFPPCMLVNANNAAQLPASPMRAFLPAQTFV